ncbi:hypothetical protein GQX74_013405 [Glossina fuscipes]|nr:hypothetical protein GQX74_013405 [Glossina fuscipes]
MGHHANRMKRNSKEPHNRFFAFRELTLGSDLANFATCALDKENFKGSVGSFINLTNLFDFGTFRKEDVMTMIIIEKENTKTFAYVLQDITKLNIVEFRIAHKDNIKFVLAVRSSGLTFYTTIDSLMVLMAMKQYKMAHDESATKK